MWHRHSVCAYRYVAYLALLAMLLLVVGPVIGQFNASDESKHSHHASGAMASMAEMPDGARNDTHPVSTLAGWYEQCGYCSLFHHCPVLSVASPDALRAHFLATAKPIAVRREAYGSLPVFPHALTRAPPRRVLLEVHDTSSMLRSV